MDEKTEELRDIFIDATGSDEVTEQQEETPGSLTDDQESIRRRVLELVDTMRDRYEFDADLNDETHADIVRRHYADESDDEIADGLDVDRETVFTARMDLHLVSARDYDAPFDTDDLKPLHVADASMEERADQLDSDVETVRHYSKVVDADLESTRANHRFRDEFRELLTDADLEGTHAHDARDDGLKEATEDIESDVSF